MVGSPMALGLLAITTTGCTPAPLDALQQELAKYQFRTGCADPRGTKLVAE